MKVLVAGIVLVVIGALMLLSDAFSEYFADWIVFVGGLVIVLGLVLALIHHLGERRRIPRRTEKH